MREILFRGKRLDNGEWVTGDLLHDYNGEPRCISDYCGSNPVDPSTVGQYTGLTANGKRIFEGDVIKGLSWISRPVFGVVAFKCGAFGVEWLCGKVNELSALTSYCNIEWEVIGNVHDNPELLKGGVNDD